MLKRTANAKVWRTTRAMLASILAAENVDADVLRGQKKAPHVKEAAKSTPASHTIAPNSRQRRMSRPTRRKFPVSVDIVRCARYQLK
jgi:hypothetical protein